MLVPLALAFSVIRDRMAYGKVISESPDLNEFETYMMKIPAECLVDLEIRERDWHAEDGLDKTTSNLNRISGKRCRDEIKERFHAMRQRFEAPPLGMSQVFNGSLGSTLLFHGLYERARADKAAIVFYQTWGTDLYHSTLIGAAHFDLSAPKSNS